MRRRATRGHRSKSGTAAIKGYVDAVRKAAEKAVVERRLLRADADRLIAEAASSDVLKGK